MREYRIFFSLLMFSSMLLSSLLTACGPAAASPTAVPSTSTPALTSTASPIPATPTTGPYVDTTAERWSDDAVFYEVFVRSFYDSNGDGIGDFKGLTEKLDYLNDGNPQTTSDLGVTGLWLMPIFPSPSYHGYDVTDYYGVNPEYGTLDDFKTLLAEAHRRGIRIIIDFVINHTSDQHPWFKASAAGDPQYRDFYLWADKDPGYRGPTNQVVWHPLDGKFYYGIFSAQMPDLNYTNPAVTEEIHKVASFWLKDVGVDGFRIDGAKHLIESGPAQENTSQTHAWLKDFRAFVQSIKPDALVVGEVWSPAAQAARYVNNGELDLVFNFPLAEDMLNAAKFKNGRRLSTLINQQNLYFNQGRYAPFLANHDQTRVMTRLGEDLNSAKAAASILLTAPGTPFLYYGEEIGMTGDKPDPNLRTPMQWTGESSAGFSTGTPWEPVNADVSTRSIAAQSDDPASLLNHYRALVRVRAGHNALRNGAYVPAQASQTMVYAALRVSEGESLLILVNMSDQSLPGVTVEWPESSLRGTLRPTLLLGQGQPAPLTVDEKGAVQTFQALPELPANSTTIIQYRP